MEQLPRPVLAYLLSIAALGLGITVFCLTRYPIGGDLMTWLLLIGFIVLATLSDRYGLAFARGTNVHVDTIALFAGLLIFSPAQVLIIATLGRVLGGIRRGRRLTERLFNLGQTQLYVGVSALALNAFTTTPWQPAGLASWLGLLAAALAMYLLNTGIVAGIVGLHTHVRIASVWLDSMSPALLEHSVMFSIGLMTALIVEGYPWGLLLVALPAIVVFITLDRTLRMEAQQKQLADQNAGLAAHLSQQAEQLRSAYTHADETLRSRDKMLKDVFGELQTPLAAIATQTDRLRRGAAVAADPEACVLTDGILRNASQLTRLVDGFLALQALDQRQLQVEEVTLEGLLRDCLESFAQRSDAAQVDIYGECAEDLPRLRADRKRLEQMLGNLVDNALKFSPRGAEVLVKAERSEARTVQISVADHGVGIPESELAHIFSQFPRTDLPAVRRIGGQGLGLAIAKRIAELHGGEITIESQEGIGTTVFVTLPVAPDV